MRDMLFGNRARVFGTEGSVQIVLGPVLMALAKYAQLLECCRLLYGAPAGWVGTILGHGKRVQQDCTTGLAFDVDEAWPYDKPHAIAAIPRYNNARSRNEICTLPGSINRR